MSKDKIKLREELVKNVRSVLIPEAKGLLLRFLEKEYLGFIGSRIPYQNLGYPTLLECLRSIPEAVTVHPLDDGNILVKAVISQKTKHIGEMVQRQNVSKQKNQTAEVLRRAREIKQNMVPNRSVPPETVTEIMKLLKITRSGISTDDLARLYRSHFGTDLEYRKYGFNTITDLCFSLKHVTNMVTAPRGAYLLVPRPDQVNEWEKEELKRKEFTLDRTQPQIKSIRTQIRHKDSTSSSTSIPGAAVSAQNLPMGESSSLTIPPLLRSKLIDLIQNYKDGLPIRKLREKYFETYKQNFDYNNFNCVSINEFCLRADIFQMKKHNNQSEYWLYPIGIKVGELPSCEKDPKPSAKKPVPSIITDRIKKTLINYENGLPISTFMKHHNDVNKCKLDPERFGYKDLRDMFRDMKCLTLENDIVNLVRNDPFVSFKPSQLTDAVLTGEEGQQIPKVDLSEVTDDYIDVFVEEIVNPGNFFVQLLRKECRPALKAMMVEMNKFYKLPESNQFQVHTSNILVGFYCAAIFMKEWTRATVIKIKSMAEIKVFFFDYGTIDSVPLQDIRFLSKKFSHLPAQGILCRSSDIAPVNGLWTKDSVDAFVTLTSQSSQGLVAKITGIQNIKNFLRQEQILSLRLIDTCSNDLPDGININEKMIELGHAIPSTTMDNCQVSKTDKFGKSNTAFQNMAAMREPLLNSCEQTKKIAKAIVPPFNTLPKQNILPQAQLSSIFRPLSQIKPSPGASRLPAIEGPPGKSVKFPENRNILKAHVLTNGLKIHVINVKECPHVVSKEISNMFPKWKKRDLLRKMITLKDLRVEEPLVVTKKDGEPLFAQALCEDVPGFENPDGNISEKVELYSLSDLPIIVNAFANQNTKEMMDNVNQVMMEFNPLEDYWKIST